MAFGKSAESKIQKIETRCKKIATKVLTVVFLVHFWRHFLWHKSAVLLAVFVARLCWRWSSIEISRTSVQPWCNICSCCHVLHVSQGKNSCTSPKWVETMQPSWKWRNALKFEGIRLTKEDTPQTKTNRNASFSWAKAQHVPKVKTRPWWEEGTNYAYVCKTILQLYTTLLYIEGVKSGYCYM